MMQNNNPRMLSADFIPARGDVLCGRDQESYMHEGNRFLRQMIKDSIPDYMAAKTKVAKSQIVSSIVRRVRNANPNGGFVRKDLATRRWFEIGETKGKEKVGQAIRIEIRRSKQRHPTNGNGNTKPRPKAAPMQTSAATFPVDPGFPEMFESFDENDNFIMQPDPIVHEPLTRVGSVYIPQQQQDLMKYAADSVFDSVPDSKLPAQDDSQFFEYTSQALDRKVFAEPTPSNINTQGNSSSIDPLLAQWSAMNTSTSTTYHVQPQYENHLPPAVAAPAPTIHHHHASRTTVSNVARASAPLEPNHVAFADSDSAQQRQRPERRDSASWQMALTPLSFLEGITDFDDI